MTVPSQTAWSSRWRWVPRRLWIAVLTTVIAVTAAAAIAKDRPHTFTSKSVVVVASGAGQAGPGGAAEAASLAITYAGLIPEDNAVISALSGALGISRSAVAKDLQVSVEGTTALMNLTFTASTPSVAIAGARDAATLVAGRFPVTTTIPRGSLQVVGLAASAVEGGISAKRAGAIGAILGITFGAVLIVTWEHLDARVDGPEDLAGTVSFPVWDGRLLSEEMWDALAARCRKGVGDTAHLALVTPPGAERSALEMARHFPPPTAVVEGPAAAEGHSGPVVLVVPTGCPVKAVTGLVETLRQLGVVPTWGLVAPVARRRLGWRPRQAADAWPLSVLAVGRRGTERRTTPQPIARGRAENRP